MNRRSSKWVSMLLICLSALFLFSACIGSRQQETPKTRDLTWAMGTEMPLAEEFFEDLLEGDTVAFAEKDPWKELQRGINEIAVIYQPKDGKKQNLTVKITMIDDTEKPRIIGAKDLMAYVGDTAVAYYSGVSATDNCHGNVKLKVNSSAVDLTQEGEYPVTYYATDHAGNVSMAEVTVHVYKEKITQDMLNAVIDRQIQDLGLLTMDKADQVRAIYQFVHTDAKIQYVDTSDKTDWVREAYISLKNRKGDCFSYFSVSKAFFERLGIENLDVQRLPGYTDDTHYWSMVNIAEKNEQPVWYHYDATRIKYVSSSTALLTDAQVDAFSRLEGKEYWFYYDRSQYPATSTDEITPDPKLDLP